MTSNSLNLHLTADDWLIVVEVVRLAVRPSAIQSTMPSSLVSVDSRKKKSHRFRMTKEIENSLAKRFEQDRLRVESHRDPMLLAIIDW